MDTATVIDLGRQSIWMIALVCTPLLTVALVVGLVIGVIQAATSINEMTLSFLPKLIAVTLIMMLLGSWQLEILMDFARRIFERIPDIAG